MSSQVFSAIVRESIHRVFNEKCYYCDSSITYNELEVDHLVPESLINNEARKCDAYETYGLGADFDILSYENLIAACHSCNNKKRDHLLHAGYVAIALAVIKSKLPKLNSYLSENKKKRKLASILKSIAHSVDQGSFTEKEIIEALGYKLDESTISSNLAKERPIDEDPAIDHLNIFWTTHAKERRLLNRIPTQDVINALYSDITYYGENDLYIVETSSGLRVVYKVEGTKVFIVTCYMTDGGQIKSGKFKRTLSPIKK